MTFVGGLVLWIFALLVTAAIIALAVRELILARRARRRVEGWKKAGKAREPGDVLIEGSVWSDDETPVARVPVLIYRMPTGDPATNTAIAERPTGPGWSRPFWLSTEEGDVAVDAHPDSAEVELELEGNPPLTAVTHDIVVGERLEVFGRLVREHVPGASEGGFRDGGSSFALHGEERNPIHLAARGTLENGLKWRYRGAIGALAAALVGAIFSQASMLHYEMRLLDGRVVQVRLTERDLDGDGCWMRGTYRSKGVLHKVSGTLDAGACDSSGKTIPFLLSDLDASNFEAGSDAHIDSDALGVGLPCQLALGISMIGASMLVRRKRFPKV